MPILLYFLTSDTQHGSYTYKITLSRYIQQIHEVEKLFNTKIAWLLKKYCHQQFFIQARRANQDMSCICITDF